MQRQVSEVKKNSLIIEKNDAKAQTLPVKHYYTLRCTYK